MNIYAYVRGNPISRIDPLGLMGIAPGGGGNGVTSPAQQFSNLFDALGDLMQSVPPQLGPAELNDLGALGPLLNDLVDAMQAAPMAGPMCPAMARNAATAGLVTIAGENALNYATEAVATEPVAVESIMQELGDFLGGEGEAMTEAPPKGGAFTTGQ
jgi:hypothetical protein